jgi:capsular polysaccharide biosynthesis protein
MIQRPELDLYQKERRTRPLEDIIEDMRARDIKIGPVQQRVGDTAIAFTISFQYPDRFKAQKTVQALTGNLLEVAQARSSATIAILDDASLPATPSKPNRMVISGMGLTAGLMLGVIALWMLQRRRQTVRLA